MIIPRIEVHAADHCTLSCVGCNHASPHLEKKSYSADSYIPWLDLMRQHSFDWQVIGISGGEPFLLQEKLSDFCQTLKNRYHSPIELFTNGFWLTSLDALDKFKGVFKSIQTLQISFYEPYVQKIGWANCQKFADAIRKWFNIKVFSFQPNGVANFGQVYFYDNPVPTDSSLNCVVKNCTQLNENGILYRCTYGHFLKTAIPSEGFRNSKDIVYDLKNIDRKSLMNWFNKWPLDSCKFCGCGKGRIINAAWKSDSKIKDMDRGEYLDYVKKMVHKKNLPGLEPKRINLL